MGEIVTVTDARRLCRVCGEPIPGAGRAAYCSAACRRIWARRPREMTCRRCGSPFYSADGGRLCVDCRRQHSIGTRTRRIPDGEPFADFLNAQRAARAAGRELKYSEWQRGRYEEK